MHEVVLAQSLITIIKDVMEKQSLTKLDSVYVSYGSLSCVMPEALDLAFSTGIYGTTLDGAKLFLNKEQLILICGDCKNEFEAENSLLALCPICKNDIFHSILQGKEMTLQKIIAS